jgi:hypothetical protein
MAVITLCAPGYISAQATPTSKPASTPPADLVGSWASAASETPLSTDFDKSVWGPNAKSVRNVQLTIRTTGEATLTVTKKVLDAKGKTVPGSSSIEEAQIKVGGPAESAVAGRTEYAVTVVSAERRYPDDPGYRWALDGLRVKVAAVEEEGQRVLEIRFDTPEGRGSFWETLLRQGRNSRRG